MGDPRFKEKMEDIFIPCQGSPDGCICPSIFGLYEADELPLHRGAISRVGLQTALHFPSNVLFPSSSDRRFTAARRCVANFDTHLTTWGHGSTWHEKIPEIEAHLQALAKAGELPLNWEGKLNHSRVLVDLGAHKGMVDAIPRRHPKIKAIFDEYDEVIRDDPSYTQYKYAGLQDKLKALLAAPDLELTHGRIINLVALGKKLGVVRQVLRDTPQLNELIVGQQAEIDRRTREGTTQETFRLWGVAHPNVGVTPCSDPHDRIFDFCGLIDAYGLRFAEYIGTTFVAVVANQHDPRDYYRRICHFLNWLAADESGKHIADVVRRGGRIEPDEFEACVRHYQRAIFFEAIDERATRPGFRPLFVVIKKFGEAGVFPLVQLPRIDHRTLTQSAPARPSLAEARITSDAADILRLTEETETASPLVFDRGDDAKVFAETVARERHSRTDLPDDLPGAVRTICEERLVALRRAASRAFEDWRETREWARNEIALAQHSGAEIYSRLDRARRSDGTLAWKPVVAELFPHGNPSLALRNLLALIDHQFHGICPQYDSHEWAYFWRGVYLKTGGNRRVQSLLCPTRLVCTAVMMLYLCETGANESVALTLAPTAIRPCDVSGHVTVVGTKVRSRGKPIHDHIPLKSTADGCTSAAEALRYLIDATDAARRAEPAHADTLFVYGYHGRVHVPETHGIRDDFKAIAAGSSDLRDLRLFPAMVRPTVLLSEQLRNPSSIRAAQVLARHESATTTMGYVHKAPYRMLMDQKIRDFADTVQVVAADDITGARKILAVDAERWSAARQRAQRTGLGVACADPRSGAQADYPAGTLCLAVDRCLTCPKKVVVADPQSVADMIVWQTALRAAEPDWLDTRYERWQSTWIPWLAFFEVVLDEKLPRGRLAAVLSEGTLIAEAQMASPDFTLPEPW